MNKMPTDKWSQFFLNHIGDTFIRRCVVFVDDEIRVKDDWLLGKLNDVSYDELSVNLTFEQAYQSIATHRLDLEPDYVFGSELGINKAVYYKTNAKFDMDSGETVRWWIFRYEFIPSRT